MSYNINKIYSIINHLKMISSNMFKMVSNEVVIFCPFCDDASRHNTSNHGHCYISIDQPVFNCFRCGSSGSLLKLLLNTGYEEQDGINYLSGFVKYNFIKNRIKISTELNRNSIDFVKQESLQFKKDNKKDYHTFQEYIESRIGKIDPIYFLTFPRKEINTIGCGFLNYDGQLVSTRWINGKYRYSDSKETIYFFQELNFYKIKNIIITEGCFDCINMFLYNKMFNSNDTIYISACGKKYLSTIEYLIMNYILLGKFNIHLIFDNDCKEYKKYLTSGKKIIESYNPNISIFGWFPIIGKDISDNSELKEAK